MTDLMKKAARAVVDTDLLSGGCHGDKIWAGEEVVRAVLMAVRELPDEICDEHLYDNEYGYAMYYEGWQPTIDAILADGDGQ